MADDQGIDPRFDPAYQRGYAGAVTTQRRGRSIGSPSVLPAAQLGRPVPPSAASAVPAPTAVPSTQGVIPPGSQAPIAPEREGLSGTRSLAPSWTAQSGTGQHRAGEAGIAPPQPEVADGSGAAEEPVARSNVNPFLVALVVVGIALVAVGTWAAQSVLDSFGEFSPTSLAILLLVSFGAPLATTLGAATLVGVLFVLAIRWRR